MEKGIRGGVRGILGGTQRYLGRCVMAKGKQNVTLKKVEPHSWAMAVGDKRPGARYLVYLNGIHVGEVEKHSSPSYRSDSTTSRTRWGFRGYSVQWRATKLHEMMKSVTDTAYSRQKAIERLLEVIDGKG